LARKVGEIRQRVVGALRRRRRTVAFGFVLGGAAMFVVDLLLPLGVGAGVPYALLVLVGLWFESSRPPIIAASAATTLIVAGLFLSLPGEVSLAFAAVNRGVAILVTWTLAIMLLRHDQTRRLLREEQRGTRGLLDLVEVAIVELDHDGEVRLVNRKGCEILRRDERQIVGKDWFTTFLPERMREEVRSVYRKLMSGDVDPVEYYENPVLIPDGQERIVAWHNTLLRDEAGRPAGTLSSGIDITDRKRTEEELRRREALARIGQLAAVVAHEVRNPLAGISGALQIIRGRLGATGSDHEVMGEILERIEALNSMVGALLRYANPRPPRVESVQIDTLLENTVEIARRDPDLEKVQIEISGAHPALSADPDQLHILFTNLLLNAGQAMDGRGRLRLDVSENDEHCSIAISDSGPGIPDEVLQRIFEPFFTTRSRGTGLGMAVAKQVTDAHNGEIAVDCPPRGGTTVTVRLPALRRI
jgi:PAS domain S-box-containing protein